MTDPVAAALIAAIASLIVAFISVGVALISGGIAVWNRRRTDQNTGEIQHLKGTIDRDLEFVRAKLAHRQTVSTSQWGAEFAAYQAIWKGIVDVRPVADKLVNRERELHQIGLPDEYLNGEGRLKQREDLTHQLVTAAKGLLSAIHDNAPFYPAPIREAANDAQKTAILLVGRNLSAITGAMTGNNFARTEDFYLETVAILAKLFEEIDKVESLIRERLAAVQVISPIAG